jgi:hypothetical protein
MKSDETRGPCARKGNLNSGIGDERRTSVGATPRPGGVCSATVLTVHLLHEQNDHKCLMPFFARVGLSAFPRSSLFSPRLALRPFLSRNPISAAISAGVRGGQCPDGEKMCVY